LCVFNHFDVLILKIIFFLKKHHFNIKNILKNNYNHILKQDKKNEKDGEKKKKKKKEGSHQKWISCDEPDESKGGACSYTCIIKI